LVTLVVPDQAQGVSVSRSTTVRTVPAAVLELSAPQTPVTSGGSFLLLSGLSQRDYRRTLECAAEFAGATGEVNINLKASVTSVVHPPLVIEAALCDSASQILAQSSDAKAIIVGTAAVLDIGPLIMELCVTVADV
jgi:hypothetical protein